MKFEEGQWVQGRTAEGELIQGWVESSDSLERIVKVRVVNSDHMDILGKRVAVREAWLKALPSNPFAGTEGVRDLIDLALSTRDRDWFMELTELSGASRRPAEREASSSEAPCRRTTPLTSTNGA
ncbi:IDEAL domain-containing protein [Paenibacillus sp. S-38]|uniref:IDEAL domain-containing protein n=1 Tax=Paenibacillus sp. S-38 TaxID=3416710 RepID=UPI003CEBA183